MNYIGVDMIEIARIERATARWGERFLRRIYTELELRLCQRPSSLAARFAGKEAVIKALGGQTRGIDWKQIEILSDPNGKPLIYLYGEAKTRANDLGLDGFLISLSHSKEYAIAFIVAEAR